MASLSRKDLQRRLQSRYKYKGMTLYGEDVFVLLDEAADGSYTPLGIAVTSEMCEELDFHGGGVRIEHDNPLWEFCNHRNFVLIYLKWRHIYVSVVVHAYHNDRTKQLCMTPVVIVTDQYLRQLIIDQNQNKAA